MAKHQLGATVILFGALVFAQPAWACECDTRSLDELYRSTSIAFTSRAISLDMSVTPPRMSFARATVLKGLRVHRPVVALNAPDGDPTCTAGIDVEKDYLVLARGNFDTGYYTDFCLLNQANASPEARQKIQIYFDLQKMAEAPFEGKVGRQMADLLALRAYVNYLLAQMNPEVALKMSERAIEVSGSSWIDVANLGDAYLLLERPQLALQKFDDILEIQPQNQSGWGGRYRALAQMGRWNELPAEKANLARLFLRKTSLGIPLPGADLNHAWLEQVKAEGHNLAAANFSDARLIHVDLSHAALAGANFSKASVRATSLRGADLRNSNFSGSVLDGVDLTGSKLDGADFSGADLTKCDLTGVDLGPAKIDALTKLPVAASAP